MLKVKTYLDKSPVNGIGIFANEDIPQGKIIWEFNHFVDLVFSSEEWDNLTKSISFESLQQVLKYTYKSNGKYYLCVDSAQFMNHNDDQYNIGNNSQNDTMFARWDIKRGEELLCNYFEYCDSDDYNLSRIRKSPEIHRDEQETV